MRWFYRGADNSLARPNWKKTIEKSPFFIWRGGHCCCGDLVGWTTFWIVFEWLAKIRVWSLWPVSFLVGLRTYKQPGYLYSRWVLNLRLYLTINGILVNIRGICDWLCKNLINCSIVHMNARCNESAGLSTGDRLRCNFTAKSKGSNPSLFLQLLFT